MSDSAIFEELIVSRERQQSSLEMLAIRARAAVKQRYNEDFPQRALLADSDIEVSSFLRHGKNWVMRLEILDDPAVEFEVRCFSDTPALSVTRFTRSAKALSPEAIL